MSTHGCRLLFPFLFPGFCTLKYISSTMYHYANIIEFIFKWNGRIYTVIRHAHTRFSSAEDIDQTSICSTFLLVRLSSRAEVGQMLPKSTREQFIGLLIAHTRMNNHIIALLPINRCRHLMFISQLKGVDNAKNFIERTSDLGGIRDGETDDFFGIDDEYGSDGEGLAFLIDVCRVHSVEHVVQGGDLAVCVGDDRELDIRLIIRMAHFVSKIINILDPFLVRIEFISGETDHFDTTLLEFRVLAGNFTKFCRADGGEIGGMREQDPPGITKPLMKLDRSLGRFGLEIGRNTSKSELSTGHDDCR